MGESSLFYDKLFDMGGREIAMAVTDYVPYCMTTDVGAQNGNVDAFNSSLPQELQLDGLEGSLILEFCRTRNCKVLLWSCKEIKLVIWIKGFSPSSTVNLNLFIIESSSSTFSTISSSYRLLISFILLSGVVLSNSYSSGLASVLTIPRYEKSIETVHEFAQSSFRWGGPALAWVLSLIGVEAVINQIML
ncbi:uncharacterized protein LOC134221795 [Armigeres subalbatus]|uniref:uncharacterized protein LOC134221795 n=1 Tax=Armigeres subalbatus TaxID=124917 RepID=UPI002ED51BBE